MILESRKWRLILQGLALLITTGLILGFADPVSYALQDDTPRPIYGRAQLSQTQLDGRFTVLRAQAQFDRAVALHRNGRTSYWIPVRGYMDKEGTIKLFILSDEVPDAAFSRGRDFVGRLVRFAEAPNAGAAAPVLGQALADPLAADTYVLIQGEAPTAYRPMVPLLGGLGLIWFFSLVAFTRAWRRVPRRR